MHDIKWIRDNPDAFDQALARRGLAGEAKRLIALDERRRAAIQKAEAALARRNAASKEIGAAKKSNEEATAQKLLAEVAELKTDDSGAGSGGEEALQGARRRACANSEPAASGARRAGRQGVERQCRASSFRCEAQLRLCAQAAFRSRRSARPDGFRDRGEAFRRALRGLEERSRAARARARAVHARPAHERAWVYRGQSAAAGARRRDVRYGAIAEVCRRSVFCVSPEPMLGEQNHRLPESRAVRIGKVRSPETVSGSSPPPKCR